MYSERCYSPWLGIIIGIFAAFMYYLIPAKLLICSPLPITILLPDGVQSFILLQTARYSIPIGIVLGYLLAVNTPFELPLTFLALRIGSCCWLVCGILAWVINSSYIAKSPNGHILLAVLITIFSPLIITPGIIIVAHWFSKIDR